MLNIPNSNSKISNKVQVQVRISDFPRRPSVPRAFAYPTRIWHYDHTYTHSIWIRLFAVSFQNLQAKLLASFVSIYTALPIKISISRGKNKVLCFNGVFPSVKRHKQTASGARLKIFQCIGSTLTAIDCLVARLSKV